jgi:hypothetical protein
MHHSLFASNEFLFSVTSICQCLLQQSRINNMNTTKRTAVGSFAIVCVAKTLSGCEDQSPGHCLQQQQQQQQQQRLRVRTVARYAEVIALDLRWWYTLRDIHPCKAFLSIILQVELRLPNTPGYPL